MGERECEKWRLAQDQLNYSKLRIQFQSRFSYSRNILFKKKKIDKNV